jgi:archaemetzincin
MRVGIVAVGAVAPEVLDRIAQGLTRIYPDTIATVIVESMALPPTAFDKKRNQYNSTIILNKMRPHPSGKRSFAPVLGVVDLDIYASGLNYVFGEAFTPGKAALISLWRLKPEFYGADEDLSLYDMRVLKEAVHEVGHTLGLQHCPRSFCVMHFSNSIFDTDRKQSLLCDQCYLQASIAISNQGNSP